MSGYIRLGVRTLAAELESDGDGRFQAPGLREGEYRVEIPKANHLSATVQTHLAEAEQLQLPIRLVRCGVIEGQVLDVNRNPVRGAHVFVLRSDRGPLRAELNPGRFSPVNDSGRYRLFNLPPGQYVIAAADGSNTVSVGSTGRGYLVPGLGSGVAYYPSSDRPQTFTIASGQEFRKRRFHPRCQRISTRLRVRLSGADPDLTVRAFGFPLLRQISPLSRLPSLKRMRTGVSGWRVCRRAPMFCLRQVRRSGGAVGARSFRAIRFMLAYPLTIGSQDVEGIRVTPEKGRSATVKSRGACDRLLGQGRACIVGLGRLGREPGAALAYFVHEQSDPSKIRRLRGTTFLCRDWVSNLRCAGRIKFSTLRHRMAHLC